MGYGKWHKATDKVFNYLNIKKKGNSILNAISNKQNQEKINNMVMAKAARDDISWLHEINIDGKIFSAWEAYLAGTSNYFRFRQQTLPWVQEIFKPNFGASPLSESAWFGPSLLEPCETNKE